MVGELRASCLREWPKLVVRPSAQPRSGSWQEAQAIWPLPERRGSKKRVLPRVSFSVVCGLSAGCSTSGSRPISFQFTPGSTCGAGHVEGSSAYTRRSSAARAFRSSAVRSGRGARRSGGCSAITEAHQPAAVTSKTTNQEMRPRICDYLAFKLPVWDATIVANQPVAYSSRVSTSSGVQPASRNSRIARPPVRFASRRPEASQTSGVWQKAGGVQPRAS